MRAASLGEAALRPGMMEETRRSSRSGRNSCPIQASLESALGMNLARLLFERIHRADVRDGTVADARDAKPGQAINCRHTVHDHDVDGHRYAVADPTDERIVCQAGDKNPEAPAGVRFGPVESLAHRMRRIAAGPETQIGPRVDEECHALLLRCCADGRDPTRLALDLAKSRAIDDPVLKVDADHAQIDQSRDTLHSTALTDLADDQGPQRAVIGVGNGPTTDVSGFRERAGNGSPMMLARSSPIRASSLIPVSYQIIPSTEKGAVRWPFGCRRWRSLSRGQAGSTPRALRPHRSKPFNRFGDPPLAEQQRSQRRRRTRPSGRRRRSLSSRMRSSSNQMRRAASGAGQALGAHIGDAVAVGVGSSDSGAQVR